MIVAVPMDIYRSLCHDNPCTSPQFALYEVLAEHDEVRYSLLEIRPNPWARYGGNMSSDPRMKACECECAMMQNPSHISEHYILLQALGKCNVLIAGHYCFNTLYAMKHVGIKIHKIPPFLKTASEAIEHFIIGTEITRYLRCVHQV